MSNEVNKISSENNDANNSAEALEKQAISPCCSNSEDENTINAAGGQAVLEGVMMRTQKNYAIAVRKENGEIVIKQGDVKGLKDKCKIFGFPFIRGPVNMVESLISSFKNLEDSAEMAGIEFEEESSEFEKWLEKKFGKSIIPVITAIAGVLGVILALFLFMFLPALLANGVEFIVEDLPWRGHLPAWAFNIIEGVFKIIIFIIYIASSSKLNDIKRVYQYHGAEHKTIFCYEKKEPLTVENVRKQSRFHPRCGTSFIFVILIISIFVMTCATTIINAMGLDISNSFLRTGLKLLLLPITVSFGYEFIRYAGKHNNIFTRIFSAPGLWMQRITTKEPDDEMIEVAIVSLKASLPEKYPIIEELERQKEANVEKEEGDFDEASPSQADEEVETENKEQSGDL